MMRKCHLNTCPVGRGHAGPGAARQVHRQARACRQLLLLRRRRGARIMAQLGVRARVEDLVGRADLLDHQEGHRALEGARAWTSAASSTSRNVPADKPRRQVRDAGPRPGQGARQPSLIERCKPAPSSAARRCRSWTSVRNVNRSGRRDALGRVDPPAARRACPTTPSSCRSRARPAELRRLPGQAASRSTSSAMPTTTPARAFPAGASSGPPEHRVPRRATREHHHRQHRALRRDQRRSLLPRRRRRTLCGAQLSGATRGGRRHRRPRLRIHDRRHRGGARRDRTQLRGRHVRRHRLRLRSRTASSPALQHRRWWRSRRCSSDARAEAIRKNWHKGQSDELRC